MDKFCVFCGEKPQAKNLEHVLPYWLLELTGDPTRTVRFSPKLFDEPVKDRAFSFNAFAFPACESCNTSFSALESKAKSVISKILANADVSAVEFSTLLNWFDKVRIGLWLAFIYLDKNPLGVSPHFHIARRIGIHDRMLLIFKTDMPAKLLNFMGCDTLFFRYTPSCFLLRINAYAFVNASYPFLFARRLGFPYPTETFFAPDERFMCTMTSGRNRVMLPLLKKELWPAGTELYQPMFGNAYQTSKRTEPWEADYVKRNSLSWEQGIGKVFILSGKTLNHYPETPSALWVPDQIYQHNAVQREMSLLTLELQNYIMSVYPSFDLLEGARKRFMMEDHLRCRRFNDSVIAAIRKGQGIRN